MTSPTVRQDPALARIEAALRDLRIAAPPRLLPETLVAAGLADAAPLPQPAIDPRVS
jgi:hypothetical protein